jgi:L-fuculose-phosphate aldolase
MPPLNPICGDIVTVCQRLYQRGLIIGTEGNVSVRVGSDRVYITPSGCHKGFIRPDDLVLIDLDGQVRFGQGQPSSETPMHVMLYRCRSDVQAVVHAHPPIATALTVAGYDLVTTLLPEAVVALGEVPTVPYEMPTTWAFAETVSKAMRHAVAALLVNHGSVAVGPSLQAAFNTMETVERAAQIFFLATAMGQVRSLPPAALDALNALRQG